MSDKSVDRWVSKEELCFEVLKSFDGSKLTAKGIAIGLRELVNRCWYIHIKRKLKNTTTKVVFMDGKGGVISFRFDPAVAEMPLPDLLGFIVAYSTSYYCDELRFTKAQEPRPKAEVKYITTVTRDLSVFSDADLLAELETRAKATRKPKRKARTKKDINSNNVIILKVAKQALKQRLAA